MNLIIKMFWTVKDNFQHFFFWRTSSEFSSGTYFLSSLNNNLKKNLESWDPGPHQKKNHFALLHPEQHIVGECEASYPDPPSYRQLQRYPIVFHDLEHSRHIQHRAWRDVWRTWRMEPNFFHLYSTSLTKRHTYLGFYKFIEGENKAIIREQVLQLITIHTNIPVT